MKITNIITSLGDGGAESNLYKLITNNKDNKISHTVISLMDKGKYGPKLLNKNIKLIALNMPRGKLTLKGVLILFNEIKKNKPDVVHTWLYHSDLLGGLIAKLLKIKKIYWNIRTSEYYDKEIAFKTRIIIKINSFLSHFIPNEIIYCSSRSVTIHQKIGYAKKAKIFYNGYDTYLYNQKLDIQKKFRKLYNIEDNIFIIGLIARFDIIKNHYMLIDSLNLVVNKHKKIKCFLIGKNISKNKYILDLINFYKLNDYFILLDAKENISDYMNLLDVHILPSLGEGFPNVIAESMSCGVINISTDVGESFNIIGDKALIFKNDPKELSNLIIRLLNLKNNNSIQWNDLKKQARQRIVNNFSLEKMCNNYYNLWKI